MGDGSIINIQDKIACARVKQLWLVAAGNHPISDANWRAYLKQSAESVRQGGPFLGLLLWFPKYGPTAAQRKMLTEEYAQAVRIEAQRRVALMSDSTAVRGAITAIGWFTRHNVLSFKRTDLPRALDWLAEEVAFDRGAVERTLEDLIRVLKDDVPGLATR